MVAARGFARRVKLAALLALLLAVLTTASGCDWLEITFDGPSLTQDSELTAFMLDVGQGDSILLASGGQYLLVDAGDNDRGDYVVNTLRRLGVDRLAAVVGTHPHADHIGGLDTVINAIAVDAVYLPERISGTETYEDVLDAVEAKGLSITAPKPGDRLALGDAELLFLWPPPGYDSNNDNNHSIVILASAAGRSILLCGDIEKQAEQGILKMHEEIGCDVLKVAHHGSASSSTEDFLAEAGPKWALISVGAGNSFKHPAKNVLKRLQGIGAEVYRTDTDGWVWVEIRDGEIAVRTGKSSSDSR